MEIMKGIKYLTNSRNIILNSTSKLRVLPSNHRSCHQSTNTQVNSSENTTLNSETKITNNTRKILSEGPDLADFILANTSISWKGQKKYRPNEHPYLNNFQNIQQKVYFDVYGCQMNVNDTEIIWSILKSNNYIRTLNKEEADIILIVTCAIREGAEEKIFGRLNELNSLKVKRQRLQSKLPIRIGLLGCMAERLKSKIFEKCNMVDLVAGPDAYRDLPRLLSLAEKKETAINVQLSMDETYADIQPVRLNSNSQSAFVSIMRGCDNMCTYCIVPFVRGRERSRPVSTILDEVRQLSDQGIKEVILLGQNVNSYRDLSQTLFFTGQTNNSTQMAKGFRTVYKNKSGGLRFSDLLNEVSLIDPEMRIRFTSPHPKDFPDEVLHLIATRSNICKQIHLPAQSGNSAVLERMRRGYTRESYLELVDHIRNIIPDVKLSSDFIAGFCGETDDEFDDTITLMKTVQYHMAYLFQYSMREKTTAHRRFIDDVPARIKLQRLQRMSNLFRSHAEQLNRQQIGTHQLVLIEKTSRRSADVLQGRTDGNTRVLVPDTAIPTNSNSDTSASIKPGDYIVAQICDTNSNSLTGIPLYHSSITDYSQKNVNNNTQNNETNIFHQQCNAESTK